VVACAIMVAGHGGLHTITWRLSGRSGPMQPRFMSQPDQSTELNTMTSDTSDKCLDSYELSDFSSRARMERSGWLFGWSGEHTFKPDRNRYAGYVSRNSYWGFSKTVDAEIALVLWGSGLLTLDFGNSFAGSPSVADSSAGKVQSQVVVLLNGQARSSAGPNTPSMLLQVPFRAGDVLRLVEVDGIIVINSIIFNCDKPTAAPASVPQAPLPQAVAPQASVTQVPVPQAPLPQALIPQRSTPKTRTSTTTITHTKPPTTSTVTITSTSTATVTTSTFSTTSSTSTESKEDKLNRQMAKRLDDAKQLWKKEQRKAEERQKKKEKKALEDLKNLRQKTQLQVSSESEMSEELAKTAKQLELVEEQERMEIKQAKKEKQRQERLQHQIAKVEGVVVPKEIAGTLGKVAK